MHWITANLIMFFSSVATYIAIRKAALDGLPNQLNNLASFSIPLLAFIGIGVISGDNFSITWIQGLQLLGTGIVLSYIGASFSMYSISVAPNPGYSLTISKSYVVFTTIWAVAFFDAEITIGSALAIVAIVIFSALIMTERSGSKSSSQKHGHWLLPAIGAFFCWGFLSLVAKEMQSTGMTTSVFLTYVYATVLACLFTEIRFKKIDIGVVRNHLGPFIAIGITSASFNFFNFYAIKVAPNVGFVNATNAASIGAVTLAAVILFRDELTTRKLIGIVGVLSGLGLMFVL